MQISSASLHTLISQLYAAIIDEQSLEDFTAGLLKLNPDGYAALMIPSNGSQLPDVQHGVGGPDPEKMMSQYGQYYVGLDPSFALPLAPGVAYDIGACVGQNEFEKSEYYNDFHSNFNCRSWGLIPLGDIKNCGIALGLPHDEDASAEIMTNLDVLARHAMVFAELFKHRFRQDHDTRQGLVDNLSVPALVTDRTGRLVSANALAEHIFQSQSTSAGAPGRYTRPNVGGTGELEAAIVSLFAEDKPVAHVAIRQDDGHFIMARCVKQTGPTSALAKHHAIADGVPLPEVLVILRHTRTTRDALFWEVCRSLNLTRAEQDVASALLSGQSPQMIATQRGVSKTTVRNQISAAMAKCGVKRQAELVAFLSALI